MAESYLSKGLSFVSAGCHWDGPKAVWCWRSSLTEALLEQPCHFVALASPAACAADTIGCRGSYQKPSFGPIRRSTCPNVRHARRTSSRS